ncbi:MAG TPA: helix-turn-helix domain-containing protein [Rhodanobacter sp.]|nr:helix-turn-helix domain-containing protein [Rhodanobacter sp.]
MNVTSSDADISVSAVAAAIAEPARTRMLYCLLDGHARTATELAIVAEVSASTASVHLAKLANKHLLEVQAQGRHRYYRLASPEVAAALEALSVIAASPRARFEPNTPNRLRAARTCYDHMAGALAVALHDRFIALRWLTADPPGKGTGGGTYDLTDAGTVALTRLGMDMAHVRSLRRRFACACLDWSERRPHIGGAVGAMLLDTALKRRWVVKDLDSRILRLTPTGRRDLRTRFGIEG